MTQLASQCMHDTELVYTRNQGHDRKKMLLVAMPACSAAAAGDHISRRRVCRVCAMLSWDKSCRSGRQVSKKTPHAS